VRQRISPIYNYVRKHKAILCSVDNRQQRWPKSSAISIGLRSRTLAAIAERLSPAIRRSQQQEPLESSIIFEPVLIVAWVRRHNELERDLAIVAIK